LQTPYTQYNFGSFCRIAEGFEHVIDAANIPVLAFQDYIALFESGFVGGATGGNLHQDHSNIARQSVGGDFTQSYDILDTGAKKITWSGISREGLGQRRSVVVRGKWRTGQSL
jgi:hypothetical protein